MQSVLVLLGLLLLVSCGVHSEQEFQFSGQTMGTSYTVKYVADKSSKYYDPSEQAKLAKEVDVYLIGFNKVFSTYDPNSEISKLNRATNKSDGVEVSGTFFKTISRAYEISKRTQFTFDPTVAPLVNLWGFGWTQKKNEKRSVPSESQIKATLKLSGINKIELEQVVGTIDKNSYYWVKLPDTMTIDLSAIAKGRGVDGIAELLEARGIKRYLVEIGGEISTKGRKAKNDKNEKSGRFASAWKVLIAAPSTGEARTKLVDLRGQAIATSGDYLNYFEQDGVRYSHTINPVTGYSITHGLASVSVISDTCEEADALATALMVMGEVDGVKYAEANNLAAFFVYRDKSITNQQAATTNIANTLETVVFKQHGTKAFNKFLVSK